VVESLSLNSLFTQLVIQIKIDSWTRFSLLEAIALNRMKMVKNFRKKFYESYMYSDPLKSGR